MKLQALRMALTWGLSLSVIALVATMTAGNAAGVDPNTIGTWELAVHDGRWLWKIDLDGSYEFHSEAADGVAPHAGKFSASDGVWSLEATNGYTDGGAYKFQAPGTLVATGRLGTASWHQLANTTSDPDTAGTWELLVKGERWVWQIDLDGTYQFHSEAANGVAPHGGRFSASGGYWWLQATNGYADGGTYTFHPPETLVTTGYLGTATWHHPGAAVSNSGDLPTKVGGAAGDAGGDLCWFKALEAWSQTGAAQGCP